ncbi:MAG: DNA polymerase III subunit delta [Oscillospiraceae bacterium]
MSDETVLQSLFGSGHGLSHAYLLAGGTAEERLSAADYLAAAYVCRGDPKPCRNCVSCHKAAAHIHPDIVTLLPEEGKSGISVEQARSLRSDAYIRPNEAERKVYIVPEAQRLGDSAQNALLKVLEEGPPYAAFLLLVENPQALLTTVISRCETIRLSPVAGAIDPVPQLVRETAPVLAEKLLCGSELAAMEYLVSLEKWKREDLSALFAETVSVLTARVGRENARSVLPLVSALKTVNTAAEQNVGVGHLLGWLAGAVATK